MVLTAAEVIVDHGTPLDGQFRQSPQVSANKL
jgi:hypothetical protein